MACLDTTFLIDLARKQGGRKSRARAMLRDLVAAEERLCTTRFTMAELYVGVYRSRDLEAERAAVAAVLDGIEVLEFAPVAAQLRLLLSSSNLSTGKSDANVLPRDFYTWGATA